MNRGLKGEGRQTMRAWAIRMGVAALIAAPAVGFLALKRSALPAALSIVVLALAAKHLGLMAVLLGPAYAMLRRRHTRRAGPATAAKGGASRCR